MDHGSWSWLVGGRLTSHGLETTLYITRVNGADLNCISSSIGTWLSIRKSTKTRGFAWKVLSEDILLCSLRGASAVPAIAALVYVHTSWCIVIPLVECP